MWNVRVGAIRGQNRGGAAVGYSCEPTVDGDYAVPFVEKTAITLPKVVVFDRFPPPNGKTMGKILLAKDFDQYVGAGQKAYLSIGADKGLKPGDYLRVVRNYQQVFRNEGDNPSFRASAMEDTQKNPIAFPTSKLGELP